MKSKIPTLMLGAAILVSFCPKRQAGPLDTVTPVLSSARLLTDDSPAFPDSLLRVIRDPTEWRDVWAQAISTRPSPIPRPEIDFEREMVILAAAGRMSPGDQIRVDSAGVRVSEGVFVAYVRTITECDVFRGEAYPFVIVRVRRAEEPEHWAQVREQAAHCR
jgi:hypothetical protein